MQFQLFVFSPNFYGCQLTAKVDQNSRLDPWLSFYGGKSLCVLWSCRRYKRCRRVANVQISATIMLAIGYLHWRSLMKASRSLVGALQCATLHHPGNQTWCTHKIDLECHTPVFTTTLCRPTNRAHTQVLKCIIKLMCYMLKILCN